MHNYLNKMNVARNNWKALLMLNYLLLIIGYFGQNVTGSIVSLIPRQYRKDFGGWANPRRIPPVTDG